MYHTVTFDVAQTPATVQTGALLTEAAQLADVDIAQPCGGQGRCGRCMVKIKNGGIRRRSTLRLTPNDIEQGLALACQSVVEGDVEVTVPPQEKIERRLSTDRVAAKMTAPTGYDFHEHQVIRRISLTIEPASMNDQTDDWSRFQAALRSQAGIGANSGSGSRIAPTVDISLPLLRRLGSVLRQQPSPDGKWQVTTILAVGSGEGEAGHLRLVDLLPGSISEESPLWGVAIDIGTTTVTLLLVDLVTGETKVQVAEYNKQINRGEDVISRIIYATKNSGSDELRRMVLETINGLLTRACKRAKIEPSEIVKATIAGNSTMLHLLLGLPAESIRLAPFVTAVNQVPTIRAQEAGIDINPEAMVDCLPGVASYVGADITAGVLASGMDDTTVSGDQLNLFLDVGTNGEIVLGSHDWLVTCACSAGPAFEGAGVLHGMRATRGAIEEVWINGRTLEPSYRVIGGGKPRGLCGSGLISLLAELFLNGLLDKGGHFNTAQNSDRVRQGDHGLEYVIAWKDETQHGRDIVITRVDVDNLVRAKAAIFAGFSVLADSVGVSLESVDQVLIGGAFGKYINVEKAVEIGLLPDIPWEKFHFLGNTAVRGAYLALLDQTARTRIQDIASRMTYIELSADNSFYEAFTSALFLPHTDLSRFPSVAEQLEVIHLQVADDQQPGPSSRLSNHNQAEFKPSSNPKEVI
jgi:uncharacterized 2Fe-2S/4Fe-4S cluster protein (DUF4445 family)